VHRYIKYPAATRPAAFGGHRWLAAWHPLCAVGTKGKGPRWNPGPRSKGIPATLRAGTPPFPLPSRE
jgi:hypothetical protein